MTDSANGSDKVPQERNVDPAGHRTSVLVVGAGPTGLLLASELQRRGVPCHLIDARPAPLHWDRATVVHPRSLEIFDSLGLVGRFLDAGCKQRAINIYSGDKVSWPRYMLQALSQAEVTANWTQGFLISPTKNTKRTRISFSRAPKACKQSAT
jgi:2-polyprenyl-6-methoxyphenol hydroxylase-like FAD-dependent oxidoreductase